MKSERFLSLHWKSIDPKLWRLKTFIKRHDEQMKSIKEMIKNKVGDSHTRKEEEQRLEKER